MVNWVDKRYPDSGQSLKNKNVILETFLQNKNNNILTNNNNVFFIFEFQEVFGLPKMAFPLKIHFLMSIGKV